MVNPLDILKKTAVVQPKETQKSIKQAEIQQEKKKTSNVDNKVFLPGQAPVSISEISDTDIAEKKRQQDIYNRLNTPGRTDIININLRPGQSYIGGKVIPAKKEQIIPLEKYEKWSVSGYRQKIKEQHKQSVSQLETFTKQKYSIDVNAQYVDPSTGKTITGEDVIKKYYNDEVYQQLSLQAGQSLQNYNQAQIIPEYADIQGTLSGSSFKISVNPVEKERAEWKTLNPAQQFGKALYVGATKWPELIYEQIPILGDQNTTKLSEKWIVEEGQLWDKAQKKDYGTIAWNATSSPAMIEAYTTLATIGIAKVAPVVARGAIRGGTKAYNKLSNFIPEENILGHGFTKTGSKIVSTEVGGNIYKWGAKGYRFGYQAGSKTIAKGGTDFVEGWTRIESVPSKTVIGGSRAERILMSPEQQRIAKQTFKELTTQKGGTSISWRLGQTDVILEGGYKRSMFGNKFVKQSTRITGSFVDEPLEQPAVTLAGKYGGFEDRILKKRLTEDIYTSIGETRLKPYIATYKEPMRLRLFGYNVSAEKKALNFQFGMIEKPESVWVKYKKLVQPTFVIPGTRTSKIQAFKNMVLPIGEGSEGVYKTAGDPLKEIYSKEAKGGVELFKKQHPFKTFLADTKASLQTVITSSKTVFKGGTEGKTASYLSSRLPKPYLIPTRDITGRIIIGFQPIVFTGEREITKRANRLEPITLISSKQKEITLSGILPVSISKQNEKEIIISFSSSSYKQIMKQAQISISQPKTTQIQIPLLKTSAIKTASSKIFNVLPAKLKPMPYIPIPHLPSYGLRGGGTGSWGGYPGWFRYRYREFNIPDITMLGKKMKYKRVKL